MAAAVPVEQMFLFVNPKSGGNKGQDFLKVEQPFTMQVEDGHTVSLLIFSLIDAAKREEGFTLLRQTVDKSAARIKTIVGGGDGTVMWADSEATKKGIDTAKHLEYGIVPLGTGNDFSRVAGWGGKNPSKILNKECAVLRKLVNLWAKAKPRPHDVWKVVIQVDEEEGKILRVADKAESEMQGTKMLDLPMINYFSVGQESKVGLNFDKNRTKSQSCNLCVYAWQGMSTELACTSIQHVTEMVSGMYMGNDSSAPVVFGPGDDDDEGDHPEIVGNPESLMFLNVNSYAGGMGHFWQVEADVGVKPKPKEEDVNVHADPGDGRIEVVTLPCIANIALDNVAHLAKRVHSGGPYYLEFYHPDEDDEDGLDVYCEVDGEFYHLVNPSFVRVTFLKRLQVLQNLQDADMAMWQKFLSPAVWAPPKEAVAVPTFADMRATLMNAPSLAGRNLAQAGQLITHAMGDVVPTGMVSTIRSANQNIMAVFR